MSFIYFLYTYFFIGFAIAVWFTFSKVSKIDDAAKGTSFGFKLLLMPASILLWPIVLYKINTLKKYHE
jgi:hypothetical protein